MEYGIKILAVKKSEKSTRVENVRSIKTKKKMGL